jgi:hypothetical protein
MSAYPGLGKVLMWAGVVLGAPSLVASVYFGIDVVKQWLAPAPVDANAHPIEVVARGATVVGSALLSVGDGIVRGLFVVALVFLGVAVLLFFVGRRLRQG